MNYIAFVWLLLSIWLTISLYRVFLKLISVDKLLWMALQWIVIFIFWLILYLIFWDKSLNISNIDKKSIVWIVFAWIVLVLNWFLIMKWFRMWFQLSTFTPAYAILWNVFAVLIWLIFFKEHINIYNIVWLILASVAIYFLSK